jgi:uracil-DNA glycosylase family protein
VGVRVTEVPLTVDLRKLRAASARCERCDLFERATQTVFGEGRRGAWLVMVGEQPGDREDIEGHPFVGPAGRVLDRALDQLALPRTEVYVTNVVKHFRWEPRGKRRIHKTPTAEQVKACSPWFEAEMRAVAPRALLCLGAVAAKAVLGSNFRLTANRGVPLESRFDVTTYATIHPSAVLRSDDREEAYAGFVADLRAVLAHRTDSA